MIILMIRAAIVTFALWCSFKFGRWTAIYEICHFKDGDIEGVSDDLKYFYKQYKMFHGGTGNE